MIAQCPGIKTALHVTSKVLCSPAQLPSPASFQHTLPLISEPYCSGFLQLLEYNASPLPPGFSRAVLSTWESWHSAHFVDSNAFLRCQLKGYLHKGSLNMQLTSFFFNWRIVDLQSCVSFRCTAKWNCDTCIHSFRFFSHMGHSRVSSRLPWATK